MQNHYQVIQKPIISEKSTALAEVGNRYVFRVASLASKTEVKDAVQAIFKVKVKRVHTINMPSNMKRTNKGYRVTPGWKKAIVTLSDGQKIDLFQIK